MVYNFVNNDTVFIMTEDNIFNKVHLECSDEYAKYVSKMLLAFEMLMNVYSVKESRDKEASEESKVLVYYIEKLLYTFETLRYKYLHNPTDFLKIDKSHSGFINFSEIMEIEKDILFREEKLESFGPEYEIKQRMVKHMLRYAQHPKKELEDISQRTYFERLDLEKLFLFFNPGQLIRLGPEEGSTCRRYSYHWACYDKSSNMPYIYFIEFEQDEESIPLEDDDENAQRFYEVIKTEGSRAPAAGIVARAIDQRLDDIHPKIFKRICIGPIHSIHFSEGIEESLQKILSFGDEGKQFVFHITEQFVFSEGSQVISDTSMLGKLLGGAKVREKFYLPKPTNVDEYAQFNELDEQKASLIRKRIIMPYAIHQHVDDHFGETRLISFNLKGTINGI